jgi:hypothetical protein
MRGDIGGAEEDMPPTGRFKVNGSKLNADDTIIIIISSKSSSENAPTT